MLRSWFIAYAINWLSIASQFSSKLNSQQFNVLGIFIKKNERKRKIRNANNYAHGQ